MWRNIWRRVIKQNQKKYNEKEKTEERQNKPKPYLSDVKGGKKAERREGEE
jgi:hypothetical protein